MIPPVVHTFYRPFDSETLFARHYTPDSEAPGLKHVSFGGKASSLAHADKRSQNRELVKGVIESRTLLPGKISELQILFLREYVSGQKNGIPRSFEEIRVSPTLPSTKTTGAPTDDKWCENLRAGSILRLSKALELPYAAVSLAIEELRWPGAVLASQEVSRAGPVDLIRAIILGERPPPNQEVQEALGVLKSFYLQGYSYLDAAAAFNISYKRVEYLKKRAERALVSWLNEHDVAVATAQGAIEALKTARPEAPQSELVDKDLFKGVLHSLQTERKYGQIEISPRLYHFLFEGTSIGELAKSEDLAPSDISRLIKLEIRSVQTELGTDVDAQPLFNKKRESAVRKRCRKWWRQTLKEIESKRNNTTPIIFESLEILEDRTALLTAKDFFKSKGVLFGTHGSSTFIARARFEPNWGTVVSVSAAPHTGIFQDWLVTDQDGHELKDSPFKDVWESKSEPTVQSASMLSRLLGKGPIPFDALISPRNVNWVLTNHEGKVPVINAVFRTHLNGNRNRVMLPSNYQSHEAYPYFPPIKTLPGVVFFYSDCNKIGSHAFSARAFLDQIDVGNAILYDLRTRVGLTSHRYSDERTNANLSSYWKGQRRLAPVIPALVPLEKKDSSTIEIGGYSAELPLSFANNEVWVYFLPNQMARIRLVNDPEQKVDVRMKRLRYSD